MKWTVLVLSSAMLVTVRCESETVNESGLDSLARSGLGAYESKGAYENRDRQMWNPQHQKDLYEVLSSLDQRGDTSDLKIHKKRALSVLSRWKPLGNLGVRIKSIHRVPSRAPMMSMLPEMNLISAESSEGGRPLGQPLRWGRKR